MEKHILKYNGEEVDHLLAKIEQAPDAIASEAYVQTEVANLVNSAPETLDTLGEVAKAIEDNETVVEALNAAIGNKADTTYVNTELGKKANTSHTQAASTITAGTLATGMGCATPTASTHIANKGYVDNLCASFGKVVVGSLYDDASVSLGSNVKCVIGMSEDYLTNTSNAITKIIFPGDSNVQMYYGSTSSNQDTWSLSTAGVLTQRSGSKYTPPVRYIAFY